MAASVVSSGTQSNTEQSTYNGGQHRRVVYVNGAYYAFFLVGDIFGSHLYYKKSTDGVVWGTQVKISVNGGSMSSGDANLPHAWVDGNKIWIEWIETVADGIYYRSIDTANSDTLSAVSNSLVTSSYSNAYTSNLLVDSSGNKYLSFSRVPDFFKTANDTSFTQINTPSAQSKPSALAQSGSNIWLIQGPQSSITGAFQAIPYNGSTWGALTSIYTNSSSPQYARYAWSLSWKGNNIYVAANDRGTVRVFKFDGTSWFQVGTVVTSSAINLTTFGPTTNTGIFVDQNNEDVYVFYFNSNSLLYYKKSTDVKNSTSGAPSCTWGTETAVTAWTAATGGNLSVVQPNLNKLAVILMNGSNIEFTEIATLSGGGATLAFEDRSYRMAFQDTNYEDRSYLMVLSDFNYEDRPYVMTVQNTSYEDRNYRIVADQLAYTDRSYIMSMASGNYEDRSYQILVDQTNYEDRSYNYVVDTQGYEDRGYIMTQLDIGTAWTDRSYRILVETPGYSDRSYRMTMLSGGYEDRSYIIDVDQRAFEDRNYRIVADQTAYSDRNFRMYLNQLSYEDRNYRFWVQQVSYEDRSYLAVVQDFNGTLPGWEDRNFRMSLVGEAWAETGDQTDQFVETDDSVSTWTPTSDNSTTWR